MGPDVTHLHLASRDHEASRLFYAAYFGYRFDRVFPRGDQPAATILRSPSGFQIFLEGTSNERLPPWFHFGFLVDSDRECMELHARMQLKFAAIAVDVVRVSLKIVNMNAARLRSELYAVLDRFLESNEPVIIERKGRRLRISVDEPTKPKRARKKWPTPRPEWLNGSVADIVSIDWSKNWRP